MNAGRGGRAKRKTGINVDNRSLRTPALSYGIRETGARSFRYRFDIRAAGDNRHDAFLSSGNLTVFSRNENRNFPLYNLFVPTPPAASASVSSRRTKSRSPRCHKPLTKALLLPMDRSPASEQSLANHLALDACRRGHANAHLINQLMRVAYLGWFLQRAGYGNCPAEQLKITECAVEAALARAHECGDGIYRTRRSSTLKHCLAFTTCNCPVHHCTKCLRRSGD